VFIFKEYESKVRNVKHVVINMIYRISLIVLPLLYKSIKQSFDVCSMDTMYVM